MTQLAIHCRQKNVPDVDDCLVIHNTYYGHDYMGVKNLSVGMQSVILKANDEQIKALQESSDDKVDLGKTKVAKEGTYLLQASRPVPFDNNSFVMRAVRIDDDDSKPFFINSTLKEAGSILDIDDVLDKGLSYLELTQEDKVKVNSKRSKVTDLYITKDKWLVSYKVRYLSR